MFFYKLLNFFYNDRILGQAGRKIGEVFAAFLEGLPVVSNVFGININGVWSSIPNDKTGNEKEGVHMYGVFL